MEGTCKLEVEFIKGVKNIVLGGEGVFNATVTGPGKLYIQSMPIEKTANKIAYLAGLYKQPSSKESSK